MGIWTHRLSRGPQILDIEILSCIPVGNPAKAGSPSLILKKVAILGQPPMVKRKPQY